MRKFAVSSSTIIYLRMEFVSYNYHAENWALYLGDMYGQIVNEGDLIVFTQFVDTRRK